MPAALRHLISLAVPPRCGACGVACDPAQPLCGPCWAELAAGRPLVDPGPPGVELAVAAAEYSGVAREVAHALKFRRCLALATPAAGAIQRAAEPLGLLAGSLVPVPPAPWRRRARGFDAAEELALALGTATGLPVRRCLRRSSGPRQVGRSRAERLAQPPRVTVRGAPPAEAVLVDDVTTTGATLGACAVALRKAGSRRVVAVTFARSR